MTFLNRTLLDLVGFADIGEFRAAGGLELIFRNGDPAMLARAGESAEIPMMAAGGELIVVDALTSPISWAALRRRSSRCDAREKPKIKRAGALWKTKPS